MVKVFIVDDHPLVIEGIKSLLSDVPDIQIVGAANDSFEALQFLKNNMVDFVFLDINLPDVSGIELCKRITEKFPHINSVALSTSHERSHIARMMQNGAKGYLLKNASKEEIITAIHQVQAGGYSVNVNIPAPPTDQAAKIPFLTRREKEVLKHIAEGMTNPQIADKLFVSPATIKTHRENLLMKFEVTNTAALIHLASQHGLL